MQEEIRRLKEKKRAVILAHNYQTAEVQDIADFVGDSLELARKAASLKDCDIIIFCGVRFMAETAKILSPGRKVLLPEAAAGCPLADMAGVDEVREFKENHPESWVVSYVNTSADVKAVTDVCCTSANAVSVVRNVPVKSVIFLPDKNLCWYVRRRVEDKEILCWNGYCIVHRKFTVVDVQEVRKTLPDAELMVHPECDPEIQKLADQVLSTSGMLKRLPSAARRK